MGDLLDEADRTLDAAKVTQLRDAAMDRFTRAALGCRRGPDLGHRLVRPGETYVQLGAAAGDAGGRRDIVAGLGYLRAASIDPDGDPATTVGLVQQRFDTAYRGLKQHEQIEG